MSIVVDAALWVAFISQAYGSPVLTSFPRKRESRLALRWLLSFDVIPAKAGITIGAALASHTDVIPAKAGITIGAALASHTDVIPAKAGIAVGAARASIF